MRGRPFSCRVHRPLMSARYAGPMYERAFHARDLFECRVRASDGDVGRVHDLYVDDRCWTVRYLVVHTGRWLPGRRVLVTPASVLGTDRRRRRLDVALTRAQILGSPGVDTDRPVSRQHEVAWHEYYGIPFYWTHDAVLQPETGGDQHLRSVRAIAGYTVRSGDRAVGHVADVVLEAGSWAATGLVVARSRWPRGERLVAPVQTIERVSWPGKTVYVQHDARAVPEARTA
jgi:sporulation protein YlmC with PRC-barrel domain